MPEPFALETQDPRFTAGEPVTVNGYRYEPAGRINRLRQALERCAVIVDRNLYRQHEKVEDVPKIARAALAADAPAEGRN